MLVSTWRSGPTCSSEVSRVSGVMKLCPGPSSEFAGSKSLGVAAAEFITQTHANFDEQVGPAQALTSMGAPIKALVQSSHVVSECPIFFFLVAVRQCIRAWRCFAGISSMTSIHLARASTFCGLFVSGDLPDLVQAGSPQIKSGVGVKTQASFVRSYRDLVCKRRLVASPSPMPRPSVQ